MVAKREVGYRERSDQESLGILWDKLHASKLRCVQAEHQLYLERNINQVNTIRIAELEKKIEQMTASGTMQARSEADEQE